MKINRMGVALAFAAAASSGFAADVGVSVEVSEPGLYGRIDIGRVSAPPVVVYPQPVVIAPTPVAVHQQPIYLHVPPGHAKNWGKHCAKYNACGQPVMFVQEAWYQQHYAPSHQHGGSHHGKPQKQHGNKHGKGNGKGNGKH